MNEEGKGGGKRGRGANVRKSVRKENRKQDHRDNVTGEGR